MWVKSNFKSLALYRDSHNWQICLKHVNWNKRRESNQSCHHPLFSPFSQRQKGKIVCALKHYSPPLASIRSATSLVVLLVASQTKELCLFSCPPSLLVICWLGVTGVQNSGKMSSLTRHFSAKKGKNEDRQEEELLFFVQSHHRDRQRVVRGALRT